MRSMEAEFRLVVSRIHRYHMITTAGVFLKHLGMRLESMEYALFCTGFLPFATLSPHLIIARQEN
jgi:hypothetical protein